MVKLIDSNLYRICRQLNCLKNLLGDVVLPENTINVWRKNQNIDDNTPCLIYTIMDEGIPAALKYRRLKGGGAAETDVDEMMDIALGITGTHKPLDTYDAIHLSLRACTPEMISEYSSDGRGGEVKTQFATRYGHMLMAMFGPFKSAVVYFLPDNENGSAEYEFLIPGRINVFGSNEG